MNRRARERAIVALAFAAPLAIALGLQALESAPGPGAAFASPIEDIAIEFPARAAAQITDQQRAAQAFAAIRRADPVGEAPLLYPLPAPAEAAQASAPAATPDPAITVNSIMAGRGGAMATVNRKLRRVGDEVAPGWKVSAIDPEAGTVTIAGPEGREIVARRAGS